MNEIIKLKITDLGDSCDGIAIYNDKKVYIPFTLPNEEVEIEIVKEKRETKYILKNIINKSPKRAEPICPFYTKCGGCCAQHLSTDYYDEYKNQVLNNSLKHKNIESKTIIPLKKVGQNSRRRVSLSYKNFGDNFVLGFKEAATHYTINIPHCPLLTDALNNIIKPTYNLLKSITKKGETGFVNITEVENGLDFTWSPHRVPTIDLDLTEKFSEFGKANNVIQITRAGKEIIYTSKTPVVKFEDAIIPFPPSAFLQPSLQGENLLKKIVLEYIKNNKASNVRLVVADLFCGLGTFTIPLSKLGEVTGYDIFSPSVEKLKEYGKGKIKAIEQNLFDDPVKQKDLEKFDIVILDPPRAGALSQVEELSKTKVPLIIYISCDPSTFARDAKILCDSGYILEKITPVDQFPYTNHLEVISLFAK